jgi:hypothetical protein
MELPNVAESEAGGAKSGLARPFRKGANPGCIKSHTSNADPKQLELCTTELNPSETESEVNMTSPNWAPPRKSNEDSG